MGYQTNICNNLSWEILLYMSFGLTARIWRRLTELRICLLERHIVHYLVQVQS